MSRSHRSAGRDVAVVGGGVVGLTVAWSLARRGHRVTTYDPAPARGASWAAAGMLSPAGEAWYGEEALLRLGVASLARWPDMAAALERDAGRALEVRTEGTLLAAATEDDAREQERFREALKRRGGRSPIRLAASDEPDTEGHTLTRSTSVVINLDDDDTEGHAFAIHFPTREQADDLRRRLLLAGALTGFGAGETVAGGTFARHGGGKGANPSWASPSVTPGSPVSAATALSVSIPRRRSHAAPASSRARMASGSSSSSRNPNMPQAL